MRGVAVAELKKLYRVRTVSDTTKGLAARHKVLGDAYTDFRRSLPFRAPVPTVGDIANAPSVRALLAQPPQQPTVDIDEDEAMWDALDDLPNEPFVPKPAPTHSMDEDEDMWDMMREMEMEAEAAAKASNPLPLPSSSTNDVSAQPAPGPGGLVGQDPTRKASNDEGWDEMYA